MAKSKDQIREDRRDRADAAKRAAALSTDWAAHYAKGDAAARRVKTVTPPVADAELTAAVDALRDEIAAAPARPGSARAMLERMKSERGA